MLDKIADIRDINDKVNEVNRIEWKGTEDWNYSLNYRDNYTEHEKRELTPLSDDTKDKLISVGYDLKIIEKIKTEEEAKIYIDAGLVCTEINGKFILINPNIDYQQVDPVTGKTNLDRMKEGLAPLDKQGKPIELHHIGQNNDSPLAELTREQHTGGGNDTILHDKKIESEINRREFATERKAHWKARHEQFSIGNDIKGV